MIKIFITETVLKGPPIPHQSLENVEKERSKQKHKGTLSTSEKAKCSNLKHFLASRSGCLVLSAGSF